MAVPTFGYGGEQQQAPPGLAAMTVPERIKLTSSVPSAGEEHSNMPGGQYRPMKVPDRITLGESEGVQGVAARQSGEAGGAGRGGMAPTTTIVAADDKRADERSRFVVTLL